MNFPHKGYARPAFETRPDHRALLATAIARQANGWTARAMMVAARKQRSGTEWASDGMNQRIQYFSSHISGHSSRYSADERPFGSFFPQETVDSGKDANAEADIYQYNSVNFKALSVEQASAELQLSLAGQEILRTL